MRKRWTETAWFGPKTIGWGWSPRSWQGWLITGVFVALTIASAVVFSGAAVPIAIAVLAVLFIGVATVTGDPPG
ncbi:MAG: hypothetical protein L0H59_15145 [Tomitella sp.]|nr:hypothetical protein [Tomitella sp.]